MLFDVLPLLIWVARMNAFPFILFSEKKYPRCDFLRVLEQSEANRDTREARHALIMSASAGFVEKRH